MAIKRFCSFLLLYLMVNQPIFGEVCDQLCYMWKATVFPEPPNYTQPVPYRSCFHAAAKHFSVPEAILVSVAAGESDFRTEAISSSNAIGVMQIKWPITAKHLGVEDRALLFRPCDNIFLGAKYLSELLFVYRNDIHRTLGAYYWGPSRVGVNGALPEEAANYSLYIYGHYTKLITKQISIVPAPKEVISHEAAKSNWIQSLELEKDRLSEQKRKLLEFYRNAKRDIRVREVSVKKVHSG